MSRIRGFISGRWLDFGCATGGYTEALIHEGADHATGIDIETDRIAQATARNEGDERLTFIHVPDYDLPFDDSSFDGVLLNEVLEHVEDQQRALREISRVLRDDGVLVVMSPNRWFPVEGHLVHVRGRKFGPAPLIPWLPVRLTRRWTEARNYWPHQLIREVASAGFSIASVGYIWPVMEQYRWLPGPIIHLYRRFFERFDDMPVIKRFGVSTLVVARKSAVH